MAACCGRRLADTHQRHAARFTSAGGAAAGLKAGHNIGIGRPRWAANWLNKIQGEQHDGWKTAAAWPVQRLAHRAAGALAVAVATWVLGVAQAQPVGDLCMQLKVSWKAKEWPAAADVARQIVAQAQSNIADLRNLARTFSNQGKKAEAFVVRQEVAKRPNANGSDHDWQTPPWAALRSEVTPASASAPCAFVLSAAWPPAGRTSQIPARPAVRLQRR